MLLTVLIVAQLVFDVALLALVVITVVRRKAAAALTPPDWYAQFLGLAQDLLAATEPVLEALEARRLPPEGRRGDGAAEGEIRNRHREALALVRSGMSPEEVARRHGLLPGELRLIRNVVLAEAAQLAAARE